MKTKLVFSSKKGGCGCGGKGGKGK